MKNVKRVPEDMTLGDEYLEKIVLASDVEERDFEEDGIRYHEFKTKKMNCHISID